VKYSLSKVIFIAGYTNDLPATNSEKEASSNYTIQPFSRQYIDANLYVQLLAANK
jgi:hypothetical protein